jgi:oxygen-independent coproporphyrinogen-3 oxidase
MVSSICSEVSQRAPELRNESVETIYFGGGTPSHISDLQLKAILDAVHGNYTVSSQAEVTFECNPEDLSAPMLESYLRMGVDRLSIGLQSFDDTVLHSMNRAHDAAQAKEAVLMAQRTGFNNISVDLIYGHMLSTRATFQEELSKFIELEVQHISAYALTIEENTYFHHLEQSKGKTLAHDDLAAEQFLMMREALITAGYHQYEISNFALPNYESRHNSAYWTGEKYLGIGPSAHSYDGRKRSWNIANNHGYMKALEEGREYRTTELLDDTTRYNEYVLTRLRTAQGLDLELIHKEFGIDIMQEYADVLKGYPDAYLILDGKLTLSERGLLMADRIASELFKT